MRYWIVALVFVGTTAVVPGCSNQSEPADAGTDTAADTEAEDARAEDGGGDTVATSDGRSLPDGEACGASGQECCESEPRCADGLTCCEGVPAEGTCYQDPCPVSDRDRKEGLERVDTDRALEQLADLPIYRWSYENRGTGRRHVGPMAGDFRETFGVGGDEHLNVVDANGVSMAAIQELYRRLEELKRENRRLKERVEALEAAE